MLSLAPLSSVAQTSKMNSVLDMSEFIHDWRISKQFTLDVADVMPAGDYGFKPNPEEMSFGDQMLHVAVSNVYRFHEITGIEAPFPIDLAKPLSPEKANVVKVLTHLLTM